MPHVHVTAPKGALNAGTRHELAAAVGAIVDDIVGPMEGRLNHWARNVKAARAA